MASSPAFDGGYARHAAIRAGIIPPGFVYFILADGGLTRPMVKIGYSERALHRRLREHQCGSPAVLSIIAAQQGDQQTEARLHARFAALRSHGEWFFYEGELRRHVEVAAGLAPEGGGA